MAVACGLCCTSVISEYGKVWVYGANVHGNMGLADLADRADPVCIGEAEVFGDSAVVMLSAASLRTACVTDKGVIITWGAGVGSRCSLGLGDREVQLRPVKVCMQIFNGSKVVMVACGDFHTLALTMHGSIFSCGRGRDAQLGLDDQDDRLFFTRVPQELLYGLHIVMVAAGGKHSMAVDTRGQAMQWGSAPPLGLPDSPAMNPPHTLVPQLILGQEEVLRDYAVVLVSTGNRHRALVTKDGTLWTLGKNENGQLGMGDLIDRPIPMQVGVALWGSSSVHTAACGLGHTLIVTKNGKLWVCGRGQYGVLGLGNENDQLLPVMVGESEFNREKIISVATSTCHSAAITQSGTVFLWGTVDIRTLVRTMPLPMQMPLESQHRAARWHAILPQFSLAFAMGLHHRLGSLEDCLCACIDNDLVKLIMTATRPVLQIQSTQYPGLHRLVSPELGTWDGILDIIYYMAATSL